MTKRDGAKGRVERGELETNLEGVVVVAEDRFEALEAVVLHGEETQPPFHFYKEKGIFINNTEFIYKTNN